MECGATQVLRFHKGFATTRYHWTCLLQGAGLNNFVEWNVRRDIDRKVSELQEALVEMISGDSDVPPQEVLNQVKARKEEHKLPDRWAALLLFTVLTRGTFLLVLSEGPTRCFFRAAERGSKCVRRSTSYLTGEQPFICSLWL
eukprot:scaffold160391_cov14-Tisochrysis_lutea.AAC.1